MLKKEKLLISLVMITLMVLVFGSLSSLATELPANTQNKITITGNVSATNTNTNTNANTNSATISGTVNAVSNSTNNTSNSSSYNSSTTNSTKLPYAGTNSSMIFIVIGFAVSAIYAYKKVSDYNV